MLFVTALVLLCASTASAQHLNVYGEPLQPCGQEPGSGEGDACTFRGYDRGAHQVCVTSLPGGFSASTGQGSWSDEFIGQNWCICIWAYASFVTNSGNLPVKCDALPEEVLSSRFSLDKFRMGSHNFQDAIDTMCETCSAQAPSEAARSVLSSSCHSLRTAAMGSGKPIM
eukprot:CAMPEP_0118935508 /NCGR_PEP_ID=MMETSP1169-20130426/15679_1 /TAXON_ID=36882 /ORGANISM="Pyramimonas obovata, Strain CCMP722" /LENGTH=169 /DNA_ID=CAMNT_0006878553 /DNA_START=128 /DNA_END=637 /DNA_ORIENTATION=+